MTLIIKELIVRGNVLSDNSQAGDNSVDKEDITQYLEQLKKDIEKECVERIIRKLETRTVR